jgi:diguanylate cyclase (GGDEF)-like protein
LLLDRLEAAIQRARRNNTLLGVMLMDIDRFKQINDTRGHATGDILLQQVAERLAGALRATDTIARLGGDEFTVLVENASTVDEITSIAEKVKNIFALPFDTESGEVYTTTSIGITIFPFDDTNRDELLKNADVAMYHAKQERNAWQLFQPDMKSHSADRLNMEVELRHAPSRGELTLAFQPQVAVKSGRIVGVEALIRWRNATLGQVSPAEFIPLAEDSGLIVPLGEWILRDACEKCRAWQDAGVPIMPVSVNLSATQFRRGNILDLVRGLLREYALDPAWIALEITESGIMKHPEETIRVLSGLRDIGIGISIDDFGTGYSSLSYLKRFPVSKIKVDQSFVRDIGIDPNDAAIVSAVVAMSKQLGLKTIAEGVETAEQLAFLERLDCDEYQGYYFSKPASAHDIAELILGKSVAPPGRPPLAGCQRAAASSSRIAVTAARPAASPAAILAWRCLKSLMRERVVSGRITTSAACASAAGWREISTATTTSAPMSRARRAGTRLATPPSTYASPRMSTGQKKRGTLAEARTATPVLPRLNIASSPLASRVATAAKGLLRCSMPRPFNARFT